MMRREHDIGGAGDAGAGGDDATTGEDHHGAALIDQMIEALVQGAELPPREVEGVNEEFCDCMFYFACYPLLPYYSFPVWMDEKLTAIKALDRVPRSSLKASQSCPICSNPFLDDPYPLVVRLPCHTTHLFDLECVRPWLRLRGTCPLDRTDFGKKQREKELERRKQQEKRRAAAAAVEDDEDDLDGMYG